MVAARQILVSNETTILTDAAVAAGVAAVQIQIDRDFAPAYSGLRADLVFWPLSKGKPPAGKEIIHVVNNSDVAQAMGYHELNPAGYPEGFVAAQTTIQDGDPWTTTLSHEVLEQLLDPFANWTCQAVVPLKGNVWVALECCDAVEGDSYLINGVAVSNFQYPAWFTGIQATQGAPVDYLAKLKSGLTLDTGGYVSISSDGVNWQQICRSRVRNRHEGDPLPFTRGARFDLHHAIANLGTSSAFHGRLFGARTASDWLGEISAALKIAPNLLATVGQLAEAFTPTPPTPTAAPKPAEAA